MKRKISKESFDKLSDEIKKLYKAEGDEYVLELEDYEDPAELRRARDREKQLAKEAKERADALERQIEEGKTSTSKAKGDVDALERSYNEKLDKQKKEFEAKLSTKNGFISRTLIDSVARQIATELSDAPELLIPHVKARITADLESDEPATKVLGPDGKPSALSLKELSEEFKTTPTFAPIIRGSKATGAGGGGNPGSGAPKPFAQMNDVERSELYKKDPVKFNELSSQAQSAT